MTNIIQDFEKWAIEEWTNILHKQEYSHVTEEHFISVEIAKLGLAMLIDNTFEGSNIFAINDKITLTSANENEFFFSYNGKFYKINVYDYYSNEFEFSLSYSQTSSLALEFEKFDWISKEEIDKMIMKKLNTNDNENQKIKELEAIHNQIQLVENEMYKLADMIHEADFSEQENHFLEKWINKFNFTELDKISETTHDELYTLKNFTKIEKYIHENALTSSKIETVNDNTILVFSNDSFLKIEIFGENADILFFSRDKGIEQSMYIDGKNLAWLNEFI